jgi:hypothetical protein
MEVCEANDIASGEGGFGLYLLLGTIHSGYATFVIGQRSPSSMSRNVILSVKLEQPHGSIERCRSTLVATVMTTVAG